MNSYLRLGVNIDHVATIRNARGGVHPDPLQAAQLAVKAGADGITAHLREDRRHISDDDITRLRTEIEVPLNLEMAATEEMLKIALHQSPHAVCIVPEKREERTTEGGLDVTCGFEHFLPYVEALSASGVRVSLFIEPDRPQMDAAKSLGAAVVEFHTGTFCNAEGEEKTRELSRLRTAAEHAAAIGLECHAGHGLSFKTVGSIAQIPHIVELNIGHFLIGEAIYAGLENTIKRMRILMDTSRISVSEVMTA